MSKRPIILTALTISIIAVTAICMNGESMEEQEYSKENKETMDYMRVEFFREDGETEEFVGTAEWKDGRLSIDVTDSKLEEILKSPFPTRQSKQEGDRFVLYSILLEPGTREHLEAIAIEAPGYINKIYYKEKENTEW